MIHESPQPQYTEKQQLERIARADSRELPAIVDDPNKALKLFALQLLKRNRARLVAVVLGLFGVGGEGVSTWRSHGRAELLEYQVRTLLKSKTAHAKRIRQLELSVTRMGGQLPTEVTDDESDP